jgi:hypothetical protein
MVLVAIAYRLISILKRVGKSHSLIIGIIDSILSYTKIYYICFAIYLVLNEC